MKATHAHTPLMKLMLKANLSKRTLAQKAGLPIETIAKTMSGKEMSPIIVNALLRICREEIDANLNSARKSSGVLPGAGP